MQRYIFTSVIQTININFVQRKKSENKFILQNAVNKAKDFSVCGKILF